MFNDRNMSDQERFWVECNRLRGLSEAKWHEEKKHLPHEMVEFISMCR